MYIAHTHTQQLTLFAFVHVWHKILTKKAKQAGEHITLLVQNRQTNIANPICQ